MDDLKAIGKFFLFVMPVIVAVAAFITYVR